MRTVVEVGTDYMELDEYLKNWAENDEAAAYLKASMASGVVPSLAATRAFGSRSAQR
jgi:hypothetical protein